MGISAIKFLLFYTSIAHVYGALDSCLGVEKPLRFPLPDLNDPYPEVEETDEVFIMHHQSFTDSLDTGKDTDIISRKSIKRPRASNFKLSIKTPRSELKERAEASTQKFSQAETPELEEGVGSNNAVQEKQGLLKNSNLGTIELTNEDWKLVETYFFDFEYFPKVFKESGEVKTYPKTFFDILSRLQQVYKQASCSGFGRRQRPIANNTRSRNRRKKIRRRQEQQKAEWHAQRAQVGENTIKPYFQKLFDWAEWTQFQMNRSGEMINGQEGLPRPVGPRNRKEEEKSVGFVEYLCLILLFFRQYLHSAELTRYEKSDIDSCYRSWVDATRKERHNLRFRTLDFVAFYSGESGNVEIGRLPDLQKQRITAAISKLNSWESTLNFGSGCREQKRLRGGASSDDQRYMPILGWAERVISMMIYLTKIFDEYFEPLLGESSHRAKSGRGVLESNWDFWEGTFQELSRLLPLATKKHFKKCFVDSKPASEKLVDAIFEDITGNSSSAALYSAAWRLISLWAAENNYPLAKKKGVLEGAPCIDHNAVLDVFILHATIFETFKNLLLEQAN